LTFHPLSTLAEELAVNSIPDRKNGVHVKKDINLGKIAEVCMLSRELVKNIIQAFSIQIVSVIRWFTYFYFSGFSSQVRFDNIAGFETFRQFPIQDPCLQPNSARSLFGESECGSAFTIYL